MPDVAEAYIEVQQRLVAALDRSGADLDAAAPACPGWSAHDVLAHHVGVVADVSRDAMDPLLTNFLDQWRDRDVQQARDAMTARQVDERRGRTFAELDEEWRQATEAVAPLLQGTVEVPASLPPFVAIVLVVDLVVHETDIAEAVGLDEVAPSPALSLAVAGYSFSLDNRIRQLGLPALVLDHSGKGHRLGDGPVGATLGADKGNLVRVLAGRKARAEVLALDWTGDPSPYLDVLSEYGPLTDAS